MYKEHFHHALKNIRETKGYTQQYVSEQTGISRVTIARLETGDREPSIENLGKLIDFYDISAQSIIGTNK